ncbi:MAG: hypothetical protein ORN51_12405 [Akkermansiaceae bacterium]|jgi:hypothetical protein|nr:hypothetical protein [Akkermansiaceae bacterium]
MAAKKTTKTTLETALKKVPAKKSTTKKVKSPKSEVRPSIEVIARAAYLNYRRRIEKGLPGDPRSDWLEAERQNSGLG